MPASRYNTYNTNAMRSHSAPLIITVNKRADSFIRSGAGLGIDARLGSGLHRYQSGSVLF